MKLYGSILVDPESNIFERARGNFVHFSPNKHLTTMRKPDAAT
jgi:hypothetical protein